MIDSGSLYVLKASVLNKFSVCNVEETRKQRERRQKHQCNASCDLGRVACGGGIRQLLCKELCRHFISVCMCALKKNGDEISITLVTSNSAWFD